MVERKEAGQDLFSNIPAELRARPQWVVYALEDRGDRRADGSVRLSKVPYRADGSGRRASSTNAGHWGTFAQAIACLSAPRSRYSGVGYVFSADDPFTGVDLDNCCPTPGELERWAVGIVELLGSYAEFSPSGTGVHIVVQGDKPDKRCKKVGYGGDGRDVEVYDSGRFFCMTGDRLPDTNPEVQERTEELTKLYEMLFPEKPPAGKPTRRPPSGEASEKSDDSLLGLAFNAANGSKFQSLWAGNTSEYDGDESRADLALCCELAFWTDRDPARMGRLFRRSGLMRPKWDRADYAERTIQAAIDHTPEGYRPGGGRGAPAGRRPRHSAETKKRDSRWHETDVGNARRLVSLHGENIRYCHARKSWYTWKRVQWLADENGEIVRLAKKTVLSILAEEAADDTKSLEERKLLAKHAFQSERATRIAAMIEMAKSEPGIPITPSEFDADPWILNCQNGILCLKTGRLLPHDRGRLCSKLAPVAFDPKAKSPLWMAFLERAMEGDSELIEYLQRVVGYCLTGRTSEECFWLAFGSGRNGKGVFTETLLALLGDYARQSDPQTFLTRDHGDTKARDDLADLVGIRFTPASEIRLGRTLDVALLKSLTGRDHIRCRHLWENGFTFLPQFKLIISCNHKPQIPETTPAMWDRIQLIPFTVYIPPAERDKALKDKLLAELPGILAWAVQGCLEWERNGLQTPKAVLRATGSYAEDEDILGDFLRTRCTFSSIARVAVGELYRDYMAWCEASDEKPLTKNRFRERLLERNGITTGKGAGNKSFWHGIGLAGDPVTGAMELPAAEEDAGRPAEVPVMGDDPDMEEI